MRCRDDAVPVTREDLRVGADVHDGREAIAPGEAGGQEAAGRVGPHVTGDDGQPVHARVRVDGQAAPAAGIRERGARAPSLQHLDLGNRSVRALPDRSHVLPEEQVAHRRVTRDGDLVDRDRIDRELRDRAADVRRDRAHERLRPVF